MSLQPISYVKGSHHANASIVTTSAGKFQGTVSLSHGDAADGEHHVVPVVSDTPQEAMEEAKALAHRLLSNLQ
ncbi:MAG: hypothetical protein NVSMB6_09890 [Burkholderiaceae bacterium]